MSYNNGHTDEVLDPVRAPTLESFDYPWVRKVPSGEPTVAQSAALTNAFRAFRAFREVRLSPSNPVVLVGLSGSWKASRSALTGTVQFIARLAERWHLSSQDLTILLGLDSADMVLDMLKGASILRGRDAEDRVTNLFRIYEAIFGLFRDADAEREWIRRPIDHFQGRSCLEVMLGGSIEDLVDVRRAVEHIAGR